LLLPDTADTGLYSYSEYFRVTNYSNVTVDMRVKHLNSGANNEYYLRYEGTTGNYWMLSHYAVNGVALSIYKDSNGDFTTGTIITDTDWHHIAIVKIGTTYGVYFDGSQCGYMVNNKNPLSAAEALKIGYLSSAQRLRGHIDELRIHHDNYFNANPQGDLSDTIVVPTEEYSPDVEAVPKQPYFWFK